MEITAAELESGLTQFYGTESYHKFSILFKNLVLTDGTKYLAEKADALWLMDIIGSYQPKCLKDPMLRDFQLWTLKVEESKAVVTCERDNNNVAFKQNIPYTNFPLNSIKLYVMPLSATTYVIMLPTEY
jgi:hypothetical protein